MARLPSVDAKRQLEEGACVYKYTRTFWSCIVGSVIHTVQDAKQAVHRRDGGMKGRKRRVRRMESEENGE